MGRERGCQRILQGGACRVVRRRRGRFGIIRERGEARFRSLRRRGALELYYLDRSTTEDVAALEIFRLVSGEE